MQNKQLPKLRSDMEDRMNLDWQGTRSFLWGPGYSDEELETPRVAIVNT